MDIKKALDLKYGDLVKCPEDRGDKAFTGRVIFATKEINHNIYNVPYVWVTVKKVKTLKENKNIKEESGGVWPSNRLLG